MSSFTIPASLSLEDSMALIEEVIAAGNAWAEEDASASVLEESKKTQLAQLIMEFSEGAKAEGGKGMSKAEAELRALADPRYDDHIQMMIAARKTANASRVRYDMGRAYIDLLRSVHATKRAEMNLK